MPTSHPPEHGSIAVHNARPEIDRLEEQVLAALDRFGFPEASKFAVRLAMEEALVNAFRHGHRGLPEGNSLPVEVEFAVDDHRLRLSVQDQGPGFNPAMVPDCTADENLERPSGRGLMLIRSFMTSVHHEAKGARLVMVYEKPNE